MHELFDIKPVNTTMLFRRFTYPLLCWSLSSLADCGCLRGLIDPRFIPFLAYEQTICFYASHFLVNLLSIYSIMWAKNNVIQFLRLRGWILRMRFDFHISLRDNDLVIVLTSESVKAAHKRLLLSRVTRTSECYKTCIERLRVGCQKVLLLLLSALRTDQWWWPGAEDVGRPRGSGSNGGTGMRIDFLPSAEKGKVMLRTAEDVFKVVRTGALAESLQLAMQQPISSVSTSSRPSTLMGQGLSQVMLPMACASVGWKS